ncbi:hypothetical protein B0I35DRAFT_490989 [Stachybotrys elegans]|uniref:RRM domain-containing protein n=1 Tax=Stachybotrys elegans TaxID=80388 RepID=A0A8K0WMM3_9HYPO|nr:hypothetical protein B0I35DRAFT_490989 [Stachybotrys elegans]
MTSEEHQNLLSTWRVPTSGKKLGDTLTSLKKSASHDPQLRGRDSSDEDSIDETPGSAKLSCRSASPTKTDDSGEASEVDSSDGNAYLNPQPPNSPGSDAVGSDAESSSGLVADSKHGPFGYEKRDDVFLGQKDQSKGKELSLTQSSLEQNASDQQLEFELTKTLNQYGSVFVKIRRDKRRDKRMPYAFGQFTVCYKHHLSARHLANSKQKDEHARAALQHANGVPVLGRPMRIEMARANLDYLVYKRSRKPISPNEAILFMQDLGEIERVTRLDMEIQNDYKLPPSVVVSFKMFDPQRDVIGELGCDRIYGIQPYDPKEYVSAPVETIKDEGRRALDQYDKDRRSIFIGGLPLDFTEKSLMSMASPFGEVASVDLFKKPPKGGYETPNCFAFIEFQRPDSCERMIEVYDGCMVEDCRVRVNRKESRTFQTPRRTTYTSSAITPFSARYPPTQISYPPPSYGQRRYAGSAHQPRTTSFVSPTGSQGAYNPGRRGPGSALFPERWPSNFGNEVRPRNLSFSSSRGGDMPSSPYSGGSSSHRPLHSTVNAPTFVPGGGSAGTPRTWRSHDAPAVLQDSPTPAPQREEESEASDYDARSSSDKQHHHGKKARENRRPRHSAPMMALPWVPQLTNPYQAYGYPNFTPYAPMAPPMVTPFAPYAHQFPDQHYAGYFPSEHEHGRDERHHGRAEPEHGWTERERGRAEHSRSKSSSSRLASPRKPRRNRDDSTADKPESSKASAAESNSDVSIATKPRRRTADNQE